MPPFVIVIGIIALIIGAILALRATLTIEYRDALNVSVKVLFLNFKITPRKEKKVDPKDFSPRKFRRMMKKKRRKDKSKRKRKRANIKARHRFLRILPRSKTLLSLSARDLQSISE